MKETFDQCLRLLLKPGREGGFVNNPHDKGGMTNLGVTRKRWAEYTDRATLEVSEDEMRALTPAKVAHFYYTEFWVKCGADRLPAGLDHATFDFAVNSGPGRAVKYLQGALGVVADGAFGPVTLRAAEAELPERAIRALCDARLAYLKGLPDWEHFGKGWGRRVEEVQAEAIACSGWHGKAPPGV